MKSILKIFLLFVIDWVITFIFYTTRILVLIGEYFQTILRSPTIPIIGFVTDVILVISTAYIVNVIFKISSKLHFVLSQVLYLISLCGLLYLLLSAIAQGFLMSA